MLSEKSLLLHHHIAVEIGRIKNRNKNPVAERAVQEFVVALAKSHPTGYISPLNVTLLCNQLNQKIRYPGISFKEMLTKRDQFTNFLLPIDDVDLIIQKHQQHLENHHPSALSKSSKPALSEAPIKLGDLVYLVDDPISKGKHLERYYCKRGRPMVQGPEVYRNSTSLYDLSSQEKMMLSGTLLPTPLYAQQ